jgi:hypothetical protein
MFNFKVVKKIMSTIVCVWKNTLIYHNKMISNSWNFNFMSKQT